MTDTQIHESNAERNVDWSATCAIYGEAIEVKPSLRGGGFIGTVTVPLSTSSIAFVRRVTDDGHYRYFSIAETPPVLCLHFKYIVGSGVSGGGCGGEDDDDGAAPPTSLTVKWEHYPKELPVEDMKPLLVFLWERSSEILRDEQMSFSVCEFCEHNALASYWNTFHQQEGGEYRAVLLPPKLDRLYHPNVGTLIHPQEAARLAPPNQQVNPPPPTSVEGYARQTLIDRWTHLYTTACPICLDTMKYSEGIILPCRDFFCNDCFRTYLSFKVKEIRTYRTNPFLCPLEGCRQDLPVIGFVEDLLNKSQVDQVDSWHKDLKFPRSFSFDRCLSPLCGAPECMRRRPNPTTHVYCDVCDRTWCELCVKRIHDSESVSAHAEVCDAATALRFCQRYLAASDVIKEKCERRYPWIVSYAMSRQHDGGAMTWISQNGQCCPTCQTGVERTEGCFHMKCPNCASHFCYECGDLLVPPYYGTHHCWERDQLSL